MTRRGFTIIELVVSVVIILLMVGLLVAGYNNYSSNQTLIQAANTFQSNIRGVRTNALSGLKPEGCDMPGDTLLGYRITILTTDTYKSSAVCIIDGVETVVGTEIMYTLPNSVTFVSIYNPFTFYTAGQGVTPNRTIKLQGVSKTVSVNVSDQGVVGQNVPTPTP